METSLGSDGKCTTLRCVLHCRSKNLSWEDQEKDGPIKFIFGDKKPCRLVLPKVQRINKVVVVKSTEA